MEAVPPASSSNVPASNDDTLKLGTAKFGMECALDDISGASRAAGASCAKAIVGRKAVWEKAVAENSAAAKVVISGLENFFRQGCKRVSRAPYCHTNALRYDAIYGKE